MKLRHIAGSGLALLPLVAGTVLAQARIGAPSPTAQLPLAFVENRGQWDTPARFVARRGPLTAHFAGSEWTLDLRRSSESTEACAVRLTFEGARDDAHADGERSLPGRYSFFRGADPAAWRSDVPSWASIRYRAMYPGVDVRVRSAGQDLEYDLLLEPGAHLDRVVVRCAGVGAIAIDADGALVLDTGFGPIRQQPPQTWEVGDDGERCFVDCRYRVIDDVRYGFVVPQRDDRRPLVVDPGIGWSTFIGGSGDDPALDSARHPSGDFIIAGVTTSPTFPATAGVYPTTVGAHSRTRSGVSDVIVTRISANGSTLVWSTLLGGTSGDAGLAVVSEPSGDVVVAGGTDSQDFPVTPNALWPTFGGGAFDAFVSRISSNGQSLLYSTFLGGNGADYVVDADRGPSGDITFVGQTFSTQLGGFPISANAYQPINNGNGDAFVTRLRFPTPTTATLGWSTFLGGSWEEGFAYVPSLGLVNLYDINVAVEDGGIATVSGSTKSTNFPVTPGVFQTTYNGGTSDIFVSKLDPSLPGAAQLKYSTYVGGPGVERRGALALDPNGCPVVVGWTTSTFPTTPGAYSTTWSGNDDGFLFKLDASLTRLDYGTYLGGTQSDRLHAVLVDSGGTVTAFGSVQNGFPTTPGACDTSHNGGIDGVVIRMRTDGRGVLDLQYSTFLGGSAGELVLHGDWDGTAATVGGWTMSTNFPTTPGAFDTTYNGGEDAFVTQIELLPAGVQVFGASTPGCPMTIGVTEMPKPGGANFAVTCTGAPANAGGFLLLGLLRAQPPVIILGVDFWLHPAGWLLALPAASNGMGYSPVGIPIPAAIPPSARLFGQFIWPSACGPQGFTGSNAVDITVQC